MADKGDSSDCPVGATPSLPPSSPLSSIDSDLASTSNTNPLTDHDRVSRDSEFMDDAAHDAEYTLTTTGKRRKACPSSTAVSVSVKSRIIRMNGEKCWLCGMVGKHVAHVIAKSDRVMFQEFKRQGLLHMDSLHVIENLILLCPGCHGSFDERVPIWAFLPTDLDAFITREEAFQARRRSFAEAGQHLPRPDPCDGTIPNLHYHRYQIRAGHLLPGVFATPVKSWLGNPIAAILRSQSIVSGITRLDPETECGLPDTVALQLQRLLFLYSAPAPKVVQVQVLAIRGPSDPASDRDDGSAPHSSSESSVAKPPQLALKGKQRDTRRARGTDAGQQQHMHNVLATPPASNKRPCGTEDACMRKAKRACVDPKWRFGPRMTANHIMNWHLAAMRNLEEDGR